MQPPAVSVPLAVIVVVVAAAVMLVVVVVVVLIVAAAATAAAVSIVGSRGSIRNVNVAVAPIIEPKGQRIVMCCEVLGMVTAPRRFRAVPIGHHT